MSTEKANRPMTTPPPEISPLDRIENASIELESALRGLAKDGSEGQFLSAGIAIGISLRLQSFAADHGPESHPIVQALRKKYGR